MDDLICFCGARWKFNTQSQQWEHHLRTVLHPIEGPRVVGEKTCRDTVLNVICVLRGVSSLV